jgi:hypothetical protein
VLFWQENQKTLWFWLVQVRELNINLNNLSDDSLQTFAPKVSQITPKQAVMQRCWDTAKQLVAQNRKITFKSIIQTDEFKECFEGTEVDMPGEGALRNWLKGVGYNSGKGRRPGT